MSSAGREARIGLVGATGAVGQEILGVLDGVPWRPEVVAFAGPASTTPTVSYGDEVLPVDAASDLDAVAFDAILVASADGTGSAAVEAAAAAGCVVVDLSGARRDDLGTPLVPPWAPGQVAEGDAAHDVVAVPSAAAALLATLLAPMRGVSGVEATVFLPASAWGRGGIDELSRQVVAMFNSQPAPRRVFPNGLAFDLIPHVGAPTASGWSDQELRVAVELARLVGLRVDVSLIGVSAFSGISATLRFDAGDLDPDDVAARLQSSGVVLVPGVDGRTVPRPRRVEDAPGIQAARLRRGASGATHLWAAADNLRLPADLAVAATEALLRRRGVLADA